MGGRCWEVCWGVGVSRERCLGSREVWESVWSEWEVCCDVGRGMGKV